MIYVPSRGLQPSWLPSGKLLFRGVNAIAAIAIVVCVATGSAYYVAGGAGLLMIVIATWRWPNWALVGFAAFVPTNRFVILLFYHFTHSDTLTTITQLWKDGLMGVLFAKVVYDLFFAQRKTRIYPLDLLIGGFILLSLVYLIWPGEIAGITFTTRVTGFRSDTYFLIAYFVGRGLQIQRRHLRWLFMSLVPGSVLVAIVAIWQFALPHQANAVFQSLDFAKFIKTEGASAVRDRGLAGQDLPRASSLLLGDLALAFYQILLCSVAAALFFQREFRKHRVLAGAFLVAMVGTLVLTVTRSAIIAIVPALALMAVIGRGIGKLLVVLLALAMIGGGVFVATHLEPSTVEQLLSLEEASVRGHEGALQRSLDGIETDPMGRGFGTAGMVGQLDAFGQGITNENWYLQIATEIGIVPAAVYFLAVLALTLTSLLAYFRLKDVWLRVLTLTMTGGGLGFLVVGNTLHAFEVPIISMLFWVLAGLVVRARELDQDPHYAAAP